MAWSRIALLVLVSCAVITGAEQVDAGRGGRAGRPGGFRPSRPYESRPYESRPYESKPYESKPYEPSPHESPRESVSEAPPPEGRRYIPTDPFAERPTDESSYKPSYESNGDRYDGESRFAEPITGEPKLHDLMESAIDAIRIVAILPKIAEFHNVYGREATANDEKQIQKAEDTFSKLRLSDEGLESGSKVSFSSMSSGGQDDLLTNVVGSSGTLALVVGHSTGEGANQVLHLPNGRTIALLDLIASASNSGTPCVIVTCNSPQLGLDRDISLGAAYNICSRAVDRLTKRSTSEPPTSRDLIIAMREEAVSWVKPGITITLLLTGVGSAPTLVTFSYDEDESWPNWLIAVGATGAIAIVGTVFWTTRRRKGDAQAA